MTGTAPNEKEKWVHDIQLWNFAKVAELWSVNDRRHHVTIASLCCRQTTSTMARTTQIKRKHMQIARFCRQYHQLEPVVDFPDGEYLCDASVQETLYEQLFSEDIKNPAPPRYQLRVLKELVKRIEESIEDWDQYVSFCNGHFSSMR